MAKKKHRRKQNFKYGAQSAAPAQRSDKLVMAEAGTETTTKAKSTSRLTTVESGASSITYVRQDIMRVMVLAVVFVGIEVVLWWLFNHTGLNQAVYRLIKV